jgi:hypothetical protein
MRKYRVMVSWAVAAVALTAGFYVIRRAPTNRTDTREVAVMPPPDHKDDTPLADPGDVIEQTVDELAQAKPGLTPREWRRLHPFDQSGASGWFEGSCAEFSRILPTADGITFTRVAVFYLPDPPEEKELPADDGGRG